jgi:ADP-heptose:LPS heptosyltransferase
VERWAAVARAERDAGHGVVVSGAARGRARVEAVATLARRPGIVRRAGTQDLAGLVALVAGAGLVVCGDTGVAHLATALRRPSVLLFGPTTPATWGPCIDAALHRVLWAGTVGDPHGERPDPGLLRISVEQVQAAIAGLEQRVARPASDLVAAAGGRGGG